jgi:hypothetical protein
LIKKDLLSMMSELFNYWYIYRLLLSPAPARIRQGRVSIYTYPALADSRGGR